MVSAAMASSLSCGVPFLRREAPVAQPPGAWQGHLPAMKTRYAEL
jgi:hypothetical protein